MNGKEQRGITFWERAKGKRFNELLFPELVLGLVKVNKQFFDLVRVSLVGRSLVVRIIIVSLLNIVWRGAYAVEREKMVAYAVRRGQCRVSKSFTAASHNR